MHRLTPRSLLGRGFPLVGGLHILLLVLSVEPTAAVAPPDSGNVTVYRAQDADFETADAITATIANGTIEPVDEIIVGDTLVVALDSDRLVATMAAHNGSATERFFAAINRNATFRIVQTNPSPQRTRKIASIAPRNTTVYADGSTAYVLVETDALTFRYRGNDRVARIHGGERFVVQFGYNLSHPFQGDHSSDQFTIYPFKSRLATAGHVYDPLAPAWNAVSVSVNIAPEESLVVRVTLDNETITRSVPLDGVPGVQRVWLDFRHIEPGSNYVLELLHDGTVTDRYTGTVREPHAEIANISLTEVTTQYRVTRSGERVTKQIDDHTAVNATVMLSHGGKVQVLNEACQQVGFAWVAPGNETRVSMKLWKEGKPLRGLNHNEYGVVIRALRHRSASKVLYRDQGTSTRQTINVEGRCSTPTPPATPTVASSSKSPTSATTAKTSSQTDVSATSRGETAQTVPGNTQERTDTTATPGQPGFTIQVLFFALLALTIRRTSIR